MKKILIFLLFAGALYTYSFDSSIEDMSYISKLYKLKGKKIHEQPSQYGIVLDFLRYFDSPFTTLELMKKMRQYIPAKIKIWNMTLKFLKRNNKYLIQLGYDSKVLIENTEWYLNFLNIVKNYDEGVP